MSEFFEGGQLRRGAMFPDNPDYIRNHLAFWLDGKIGNYPDKWVDLISGTVFENHGSTYIGNGRHFDGVDDYMSGVINDIAAKAGSSTIEVVIKTDEDVTTKYGLIYFPGFTDNICMGWGAQTNLSVTTVSTCYAPAKANFVTGRRTVLSHYGNGGRSAVNGLSVNAKSGYTRAYNVNPTKLSVNGTTYIGGSPNNTTLCFHGDIYAIRVYKANVSLASMQHNHAIDMERFAINV